jgi:tetratricopeptide (TPR) repeat protein
VTNRIQSIRDAIQAGMLALQRGDAAQARAASEAALRRDPGNFDAVRLKGIACLMEGSASDAVPMLRLALEMRPDNPEIMNNLGLALGDLGELDASLQWLRSAAALAPDRSTLMNLGSALRETYRFEDAIETYHRILRASPRDAEAIANLGNVYFEQGVGDRAIECYVNALRTKPDLHDVRFALAGALLQRGEFSAGWQHYEARLHTRYAPAWFANFARTMPRWDGILSPGLDLILVGEQGIGDCIQFVRFAAPLHRAGVRVHLRCRASIARLLSTCDGLTSVAEIEAPAPPQSVWCPIASLPMALGFDPTVDPAHVPYLKAPAPPSRGFEATLARASLRIGIAWQGNPRSEVGELRDRSIPLEELQPLSKLEGIELISLQQIDGLDQLERATFRGQIRTPPLDAGANALIETAALIGELDLVISSDTAIAHLAGALGRPVWVALKRIPEWRWQLDRTDSPWYPTMQLFRQTASRDWASAVVPMVDRLRAHLEGGAALLPETRLTPVAARR